ncbi:MAG: TRAP transporter substrate-binding protein, partial [Rhodospirillales bacterium]
MRMKTALVSFIAAATLGAVTAGAADITMRLHTLVKSPHPYNDMADSFKKEVEAKSGGSLAVKIFDSGTLGKDPAVLGEMKLGTIDLIIGSTSNAVKQVPEFQVFSLPYLYPGFDSLMKSVAPGSPVFSYYETVFANRDLGIKLLSMGASGNRHMSNAKGPVNSVADIQGMKMRTPPSPMIAKTWEALGTQPVSVAWTELYAAIQTGVADGLESSIAGYKGSKLYEVAPYLALTGHTYAFGPLGINDAFFSGLSEDKQKVITDAAE